MTRPPSSPPNLILYQTEDGRTHIQCRLENETLWLTQTQIAELFQTSVPNINLHLKAIYAEGELALEATIKSHLMVRLEGAREVSRAVLHYNLAAILAVGFRVRSHRGTQFRQWATDRLHEYLVKGFAMDDERLKSPPVAGQPDYFDELLARIRDIRSSEKLFYKKVLEIYATSVDYTDKSDASRRFFQTVQNKMHWAAHGRTAAELVVQRADANKPNMGLTSWAGSMPRKSDALVAKNYLSPEELDALNRIVNLYLEFAELQATSKRAMYMADWISKLDDFLRISEREVLGHAGKISAEVAAAKAELQYEQFASQRAALPSSVERDFEKVVGDLKQLQKRSAAPKSKSEKAK